MRFLIVVIEHLPQYGGGFRITEIGVHTYRTVLDTDQIRLRCVLPTILELLRDATTTLGKTGVANLIAKHQNLATGSPNGLFHMLI